MQSMTLTRLHALRSAQTQLTAMMLVSEINQAGLTPGLQAAQRMLNDLAVATREGEPSWLIRAFDWLARAPLAVRVR